MSAPRPDLLFALPGLIADQIRITLPALATCRGFAGRFDVATLRRLGISAPAVLVSRLGARQSEVLAGPRTIFEADMAAFIITKDAIGLPRDEAAQNISSVLLRLIPEKTWNQVGVGAAQRVRETGLITEASEKEAISLWGVTWMQPMVLDGYPVAVPQPVSLYVGQEPEIGAAHLADYEQIGGQP